MSRPRKPNHVKVIQGTDQPCRMMPDEDVGAPALERLPDPPDWLPNAHAVREFRRLGAIAVRLGRLTEANLSLFAHLCALHGRIAQLWHGGAQPRGTLIRQYRAFGADLGLSSVIGAIATRIGSEPAKRFDRFRRKDDE